MRRLILVLTAAIAIIAIMYVVIPKDAEARHTPNHAFAQRVDRFCEATFPGAVAACNVPYVRCDRQYATIELGTGRQSNPYYDCSAQATCTSNGFNFGSQIYHGWVRVRDHRVFRFPGETWERCRT